MRPPSTPEAIALRALGMRAFGAPHRSAAGSYSSTAPVEYCARAGWTAASFGPVTAPPMTYILSPTVTATGEPRFVGSGASARQVSRVGSYSQALSIGTHAAGPDCGSTKPPKA